MNRDRLLDAVWSVCGELAARDGNGARRAWDGSGVLREAAGCVLASQVPHPMAVAAVERLARERLLPPADIAHAEEQIAATLRHPLSRDYPRAYRFPVVAARRLLRLASIGTDLANVVLFGSDVVYARKCLISYRCGLGPKQASLLLRNVRSGAELAVLDVHLVAFMRAAGLTTTRTVPTALARYEDLEGRLRCYAQGLRMPIERLDMAAWVVMRAARGEERAWLS